MTALVARSLLVGEAGCRGDIFARFPSLLADVGLMGRPQLAFRAPVEDHVEMTLMWSSKPVGKLDDELAVRLLIGRVTRSGLYYAGLALGEPPAGAWITWTGPAQNSLPEAKEIVVEWLGASSAIGIVPLHLPPESPRALRSGSVG